MNPGDADFKHVTITWTPDAPANPVVETGNRFTVTISKHGIRADVSYTFTVKTVDDQGTAALRVKQSQRLLCRRRLRQQFIFGRLRQPTRATWEVSWEPMQNVQSRRAWQVYRQAAVIVT